MASEEDPAVTAVEMIRGNVSGGATTSHTIVVPALRLLMSQVGTHASANEYEQAVMADNILGKDTVGARRTHAALPAGALHIAERLLVVPSAGRSVERGTSWATVASWTLCAGS